MQFGMIEGEVEHMLTDLEFQDKRDTIANNLSGGMKRKLRYKRLCVNATQMDL